MNEIRKAQRQKIIKECYKQINLLESTLKGIFEPLKARKHQDKDAA